MPTELREHQHELMLADETLSLVFGTEDTSYLTLSPPSIGSLDGQIGDVKRNREDGIAFGEDYLGGKSVTFEIGVLTDRAANPWRAGADALSTFEAVWKNKRFRNSSLSYAVLRSNVGGVVTRAYGRPRRYEEEAGNLTVKGYTPIVCDFAVADGRFYEDNWRGASVNLSAASDGGFSAPFQFPLTSYSTESQSADMQIGGIDDTWPVITFFGPVTNPRLNLGAFRVGLDGSIPSGMEVTVDPRPWSRMVTRTDGANYAGRLTWDTPPLRKMLLGPGGYDLTYSGVDGTGKSWVQVLWRNAYPRP